MAKIYPAATAYATFEGAALDDGVTSSVSQSGATVVTSTDYACRGSKSAKCSGTIHASNAWSSRLKHVISTEAAAYEMRFNFLIPEYTPGITYQIARIAVGTQGDGPSMNLGIEFPSTGGAIAKFSTWNRTVLGAYATTGRLPAIVPGVWHQVVFQASGFTAEAGNTITPKAWIDGHEVIATGTITTSVDGWATGCFAGIASAAPDATGRSVAVYIDNLTVGAGATAALSSLTQASSVMTYLSDGGHTVAVTTPIASTAELNIGAETFTMTPSDENHLYHTYTAELGGKAFTVTTTSDTDETDTETSPEYIITSNPGDASSNVIVVSDLQDFNDRAAGAILAAGVTPELCLLNGDITDIQGRTRDVFGAYDAATKLWEYQRNVRVLDPIAKTCVFAAAAGNHDYNGSPSDLPADLDYFKSVIPTPTASNPEGVYSFDWGYAHIAVVAHPGVWEPTLGASTIEWLKADMKASSKKWKIVASHYPTYYTPDDTWVGYSNAADIHSALVDAKVNLYIGSHRHAFNRFSEDGVMYIINSTTSDNFVDDGFETGYPNSTSGTASPRYGSLPKSIREGGYTHLTITAKYIDITFKDRDDDSVLTRFRLRQRDGGKRG